MTLPGLNHQLGDDIDALREAVRAFVQRELAPRAAQIDQDNLFPADMWRKLGELGVHGLTVSEEHGGLGFGPVDAAPSQPGMGSPAPVPDYTETIRQVLATLSLRGTADLEISQRGFVVLVSDYRDIPAVKQALRPVAQQLGISIKVEAASAARS